MKISKKFTIPKWDASVKQQIISLWQDRNVKFIETSENYFRGKRGSLLGNLTSYNMVNLATKLYITRNDSNEVSCVISVNTFFQVITSWNKKYWELELDTFESVLLKNDYKEKEWEEFLKSSTRKNVFSTIGIFSIMIVLYVLLRYFFT